MKNKKLIFEISEILLSILICAVALIFFEEYGLIFYIAALLIIGRKTFISSLKNIFSGDFLDENFLMSIASVGAFFIGEYLEGIAVLIFYRVGTIFENLATNRSRNNVKKVLSLKADYAFLETQEGLKKVSPESLSPNDIIIIKPGERAAVDGVVLEGEGFVDTSMLTGESVPSYLKENDLISSGSIVLNKALRVKVLREYKNSTAAKIIELVENAVAKKAKSERFITTFSRYYTPIVVFLALFISVICPIIFKESFSAWIYKGLSFLVVSCPCALVISVPMAFFAGIGGAGAKGILIKGSRFIEALKGIDTICFDKTGTVTKGQFKVSRIECVNGEKEEMIRLAALSESFSSHPVSKAISALYDNEAQSHSVSDFEEISGNGIRAHVDGKAVLVGNSALMDTFSIDHIPSENLSETTVYIASDGKFLGSISLADEIKEESAGVLKSLKRLGIKNLVMLTGDKKEVAADVAEKIGADSYYGALLPQDKVLKIEELIAEGRKVAFVGDGINDAPSLARAHVGIAMGALGSDAAIEAADVVLMTDELERIKDAVALSKKTMSIVWQNIVFSLGVKIIIMILSTLGLASMWWAVFGDVGVSVVAILNSMRAMKS